MLLELAKATMPFGKYKGLRLIDLPVAYLLWFRDEGFPSGRLGESLALMLEIKTQGLGGLVRKLG